MKELNAIKIRLKKRLKMPTNKLEVLTMGNLQKLFVNKNNVIMNNCNNEMAKISWGGTRIRE